jgi:lipoprotein-anchoring transpeptidase ErfK/SrfK
MLAWLALRGESAAHPRARAQAPRALAPTPAFTVGEPVPLSSGRNESRWSPVRRAVSARVRPAAGAAAIARLATRTPERTTNIVAVLARASDADGHVWVRVRLPVLPNGTTGWVPRSALGGYGTVTTRLVVNRRRLTATLLRDGRRVFRAAIGLGTAAAPTPAGEFYVRNRLTRFRSPFYGPVAFGTSARSSTLTDWPGGGFVGIHGTDRPDLLPGRVSHGCIRMRNADVRRLARLMPIGTTVSIR